MNVFCTGCGRSLNTDEKFCATCGTPVAKSSATDSSAPSPVIAQQGNMPAPTGPGPSDAPVPVVSSSRASRYPQIGVGKFITHSIRQSFAMLKQPKQLVPTLVLGAVWLTLALLGAFGINPLPVRILSFLTFAQGGMFGGVLGAAGGILGKVLVAAFLNAAIVPLFQKKAPFSGFGGGIKDFCRSLAVKGMVAIAPLLGGVGAALLLYAFMNNTQSVQNSMVGIIAFVTLLQGFGRKSGFLWGIAFSVANSVSKGRTPSYTGASRFVGGMTLGFAIGVGLSASGLLWSAWVGAVLLVAAVIFAIVSKSKREVAEA